MKENKGLLFSQLAENIKNKKRKVYQDYLGNISFVDFDYDIQELYHLDGFELSTTRNQNNDFDVSLFSKTADNSFLRKSVLKKCDLEHANPFEKYVLEARGTPYDFYSSIMEYLEQPHASFWFDYDEGSDCECFYNYAAFLAMENSTDVDDFGCLLIALENVYADLCNSIKEMARNCYDITDEAIDDYCQEFDIRFDEDGEVM